MRSPYPLNQPHWGRVWDREPGDPWGIRGQENPSLRHARAMQNGSYLSGVEMNNNEMNADGQDELLAAELEDDVFGSGIFDDPRRATANPDMGVLASRYALPGYLARERPFQPSEDVVSASGARVVPVPAGGASYVSRASVGPNYLEEQAEIAMPGIYQQTGSPASPAIEELGEDAVPMRPQRAGIDTSYFVEDTMDSYLLPVYEGRTDLCGLGEMTKQQKIDRGRRVARQIQAHRGVGPQVRAMVSPHFQQAPAPVQGVGAATLIRPFRPPVQLSGESSDSPGLGTFLLYGVIVGVVGSMFYTSVKR